MNIFEGKTSTERNKMIAAAGLGVVSLVALYMAFGPTLFGGSAAPARPTPASTPRAANPPTASNDSKFRIPSPEEQSLNDVVPVVYNPDSYGVGTGDAGRNIFAFYEPPPPCPECPTPYKATPTPKTPTPTPTPVYQADSLNVQNVYAGSRAFRLEVNGDRFTPDARIYFNQNEVPTTFVNPQRIVANIPANFIAQEGPRQIIVQNPAGTAYSQQLTLNVQPPPKPQVAYIGMIARARFNNDTAYFQDATRPITPTNQPPPFGARLNDVVAGRFRLIDIGAAQVVFEDVQLGFKHRVPIAKATSGAATGSGTPPRGGFPVEGFPVDTRGVPGFPGGVPITVQPNQPAQPRPSRSPQQKDVDDDGDGDG